MKAAPGAAQVAATRYIYGYLERPHVGCTAAEQTSQQLSFLKNPCQCFHSSADRRNKLLTLDCIPFMMPESRSRDPLAATIADLIPERGILLYREILLMY